MSSAIRESDVPRGQIFVTTKLPYVEGSSSHNHMVGTSLAGSRSQQKKVWRMPSQFTTIPSLVASFSLQLLHSPDESQTLIR